MSDACKHVAPQSCQRLGIADQDAIGKLHLRLNLADVLRDQQEQNGLIIEQITLDDILGLDRLPPVHRDPFDRLLVSQANRGGFQLVTHDPEIAGYAVPVLW